MGSNFESSKENTSHYILIRLSVGFVWNKIAGQAKVGDTQSAKRINTDKQK